MLANHNGQLVVGSVDISTAMHLTAYLMTKLLHDAGIIPISIKRFLKRNLADVYSMVASTLPS